MRARGFSEVFAFVAGFWVSVACAYGIAWHSARTMKSLPAKLSAESVAGFQAIRFARTREPFPPSGSGETLPGVWWKIRYTKPSRQNSGPDKTVVTIAVEAVPEGATATYSFQRTMP